MITNTGFQQIHQPYYIFPLSFAMPSTVQVPSSLVMTSLHMSQRNRTLGYVTTSSLPILLTNPTPPDTACLPSLKKRYIPFPTSNQFLHQMDPGEAGKGL